MDKIRETISECEQGLKKLNNTRSDKVDLAQIQAALKRLQTKIKAQSDSEEKQELLKEIDSLLFIVSSLLDYCEEERNEK